MVGRVLVQLLRYWFILHFAIFTGCCPGLAHPPSPSPLSSLKHQKACSRQIRTPAEIPQEKTKKLQHQNLKSFVGRETGGKGGGAWAARPTYTKKLNPPPPNGDLTAAGQLQCPSGQTLVFQGTTTSGHIRTTLDKILGCSKYSFVFKTCFYFFCCCCC